MTAGDVDVARAGAAISSARGLSSLTPHAGRSRRGGFRQGGFLPALEDREQPVERPRAGCVHARGGDFALGRYDQLLASRARPSLTNIDELKREIEALRDRNSRLSAAILHISASLDLDTVLHEVVDSARELTGASYGVIATVDEAEEPRDFVSSGFTPEQHRKMAEWPDGPRLFERLRDLPGPLQLPDFTGYIQSLGYSPDLVLSKNLLGTPMRHRGVQVGSFFFGDSVIASAFLDRILHHVITISIRCCRPTTPNAPPASEAARSHSKKTGGGIAAGSFFFCGRHAKMGRSRREG